MWLSDIVAPFIVRVMIEIQKPVLILHGIPPVAIGGPGHSLRWTIGGPPVVHRCPAPFFAMSIDRPPVAIDGNENNEEIEITSKSISGETFLANKIYSFKKLFLFSNVFGVNIRNFRYNPSFHMGGGYITDIKKWNKREV